MALWDALTGRVWHWNKTKREAVCLLARQIDRSILQQPENKGVRNILYAFDFACIATLNDFLYKDTFRPSGGYYRRRAAAITPKELLRTCSAFTSHSITKDYMESSSTKEEAENLFLILIGGM